MLDVYLETVELILDRLAKYEESEYTSKNVAKHFASIKTAHARLRKGVKDVVVAWDQFTEIAKRLKYVYGDSIPDIVLPTVKNSSTLTSLTITEAMRVRKILETDLWETFLINDKAPLLIDFHKGPHTAALSVFIHRMEKLRGVPAGPRISTKDLKAKAPTESLEVEQNLSRGYYFNKEDLGAQKAAEFLSEWDEVQEALDSWCEVNNVTDKDVIKVYGESDLVFEDFEEMVKSRLDQLDAIYLTLIYRLV